MDKGLKDELQEQAEELLRNAAGNDEHAEAEHDDEPEDAEGENTTAENEQAEPTAEEQIEALKKRVAELEDIRLRQMAEFDNYRRRTNKEKLDLMSSASEGLLKEILPLVDDFERAREAMAKTEDITSLRDGIDLIYTKFIDWLDKQDVHAIETTDADFNTDEHEAITTFAAGEDKKGKIIDCTQKGYKHGDKVIRFAKVVVGE